MHEISNHYTTTALIGVESTQKKSALELPGHRCQLQPAILICGEWAWKFAFPPS